jgi:hypothetical protein
MPVSMTAPFMPARAKLWIGSIDNPQIEVRAQYNPKELQIDKQLSWGDHKAKVDKTGPDQRGKADDKSQQGDLELTGAPTRSMSIELLFDSFESGGSVEPDVRVLEALSSVRDPGSTEPEMRRSHHCLVVWGASGAGMRPFKCVIESLSVKYTMWDHSGTPKRATCTVKLKEAQFMARSVGLKEPEYREKRRPPWWDQSDLGSQDPQTRAAAQKRQEFYDQLSERDYDKLVASQAQEPPAPASASSQPAAPAGRAGSAAPPGRPGPGR